MNEQHNINNRTCFYRGLSMILLIGMLSTVHSSLWAQDSRVESGVRSLQEKEFSKAFESLDQALEYPAELTGTNYPKALYYRGLTRLYIYNNAIMKNDEQALQNHEDAYLEAYNDFVKALEVDNGTWQKRILDELEGMEKALTRFAMQYAELAGDLMERGDSESGSAILAKAEKYANASLHVNDNYMSRDALGQVYLGYGDDLAARGQFIESIRLYGLHKPSVPDFYQAYVYYRLAGTYLSTDPQPREALKQVTRGIEFVGEEGDRWNLMRNSFPLDERAMHDRLYDQALEDLHGYEYEMYFKYPELTAEGIMQLGKDVKDDPGNYDLRIAYARLLEKADHEEALRQYERAREIRPGREEAWFNAGVVCYNVGRDFYAQAGEEGNNERYEVLAAAAREYFERGWPFFVQSLEINPGNLDAIVALKNLALLLNRKIDYVKYSLLEEEMRSK